MPKVPNNAKFITGFNNVNGPEKVLPIALKCLKRIGLVRALIQIGNAALIWFFSLGGGGAEQSKSFNTHMFGILVGNCGEGWPNPKVLKQF